MAKKIKQAKYHPHPEPLGVQSSSLLADLLLIALLAACFLLPTLVVWPTLRDSLATLLREASAALYLFLLVVAFLVVGLAAILVYEKIRAACTPRTSPLQPPLLPPRPTPPEWEQLPEADDDAAGLPVHKMVGGPRSDLTEQLWRRRVAAPPEEVELVDMAKR